MAISVPLPSTVGWACSWCGGRVSGITGRRGRCSVWWTSRPLNTSLEPSCTSQTPWSKQARHQGIKHTARRKKTHLTCRIFWGGGGRRIRTVRGSLSLALGLSDGTPILRHWNTHTHTKQSRKVTSASLCICSVIHLSFRCIPHLYIRRYFPSRPLSERETSKEQDTGIPLPSLFTSPAGGAQDSRAARACTLDTWKTHITQTVFVKCTIAMFPP